MKCDETVAPLKSLYSPCPALPSNKQSLIRVDLSSPNISPVNGLEFEFNLFSPTAAFGNSIDPTGKHAQSREGQGIIGNR